MKWKALLSFGAMVFCSFCTMGIYVKMAAVYISASSDATAAWTEAIIVGFWPLAGCYDVLKPRWKRVVR